MHIQQPQPLLQPQPQSEFLAEPLHPQPVSQSRRMMIRKMHQLFEQPIVLPPRELLRKSAEVFACAPLSSISYVLCRAAVTAFEEKLIFFSKSHRLKSTVEVRGDLMLFGKHGNREIDKRGYDALDYYDNEPLSCDETEPFYFANPVNLYRGENAGKKRIKNKKKK